MRADEQKLSDITTENEEVRVAEDADGDIGDRGEGDWEKLFEFMDTENFSRLDFLACICASLLRDEGKSFSTRLMVGGVEFAIGIEKR